jgi:hypothetical protein
MCDGYESASPVDGRKAECLWRTQAGRCRREDENKRVIIGTREVDKMEGALEMTDYQYESIIKMVLMILENCKDTEEARKKIESLLKKETK